MENICKKIRRKILVASYRAGACHIGSALSCVEILVALYYKIMRKDDVFIFSKASGVVALYAVLADKGFIPRDQVSKYLKKYPLPNKEVPGVIWSGGSLGQGLSVAVGLALANRSKKVYCLLSDGELQEGNTWEAVLFAAHHELNNLTVIIDRNNLQACGETEKILKLESLADKFKAFNWNTLEVDGHNMKQIIKVVNEWKSPCPKVVIAYTIKGRGVSFMEKKYEWHYKNLDKKRFEEAILQCSTTFGKKR